MERNCFSDTTYYDQKREMENMVVADNDTISVGSDSVFGSDANSVLDISYHGALGENANEWSPSLASTDLSGMSFNELSMSLTEEEGGRVEQREVEIKEDLTKSESVSVTEENVQKYSPKKTIDGTATQEGEDEDAYKGMFSTEVLKHNFTC